MRRREFITLAGGAAAVWPLAAWARADRMWHIGVITPLSEGDAEAQARETAFLQGLQ